MSERYIGESPFDQRDEGLALAQDRADDLLAEIHRLEKEGDRLRRTIDCLLPANGCTTVEEAVRAFGDVS